MFHSHGMIFTFQKMKSRKRNADVLNDVSHSVVGADLRKRRKRRAVPCTTATIAESFPASFDKKEYFAYFGHPQHLTLDQGQFVMQKKLEEIGFELSPTQEDTPGDGSCLFHAILDQLRYCELRDEVSNHQELRWKIVSYGYDFFLKTGRLDWTGMSSVETPEDWKKRMSRPDEWGDEVAITCASNVLGVNIVIAVAFQEDLIIIKSLERSKHEPLYLFYYSETDFSPAHYQSIRPGIRPILPHSLTSSS